MGGASSMPACPEFNPNDRNTWALAHVFGLFKAYRKGHYDFGVHREAFGAIMKTAQPSATSIVDELWHIFDPSDSGIVNILEVLVGLAMYAWAPSPHARSELLFTVFDFNGNNEISRDEYIIMVQTTINAAVKIDGAGRIPDEQEVQALAQSAFSAADSDGSGELTRAEFRDWVEQNVLGGSVLSAFGLLDRPLESNTAALVANAATNAQSA